MDFSNVVCHQIKAAKLESAFLFIITGKQVLHVHKIKLCPMIIDFCLVVVF